MTALSLRIMGRDVKPHKATTGPSLGARTVLTDSHWEYVSLWLRREHKANALLYWQQAQTFANAAEGMPVASAPLLLYYSFMNATKALLSAKGVAFVEHHGARAHDMRGPSKKIALSNEGVRILTNRGIAPSLSTYLGETETTNTHSLEDLLFNIPCVHRTFCLTYKNQRDLFIPLTECQIAYDATAHKAYFVAKLSKDFSGRRFLGLLPSTLCEDPLASDQRSIRSTASASVTKRVVTSPADTKAIATLLTSLRADIHYIAGAETLWYAKGNVGGPARLKRSPLTCTLLAMHRISELCRYRPVQLASFLSGQKNWLLTEFVRMSPPQFLDEIAAELTGQQFMIPNVRSAT
jgi:YaaC-like protein